MRGSSGDFVLWKLARVSTTPDEVREHSWARAGSRRRVRHARTGPPAWPDAAFTVRKSRGRAHPPPLSTPSAPSTPPPCRSDAENLKTFLFFLQPSPAVLLCASAMQKRDPGRGPRGAASTPTVLTSSTGSRRPKRVREPAGENLTAIWAAGRPGRKRVVFTAPSLDVPFDMLASMLILCLMVLTSCLHVSGTRDLTACGRPQPGSPYSQPETVCVFHGIQRFSYQDWAKYPAWRKFWRAQ